MSNMIDPKAYLAKDLGSKKIEYASTRDGYGKGLVQLGEAMDNVVVLCADLTESTRSHWFKEKFPERFFEIGVAEQNLATVAAGMARYGKIPFISSYAAFSPGRNWEQLRTTAALNEVPVKVCGAHAGISVGPDGATHQALEDMALMRSIPRMTVMTPTDVIEAEKMTVAAASIDGPVYMRFARAASPVFTTQKTPFVVGEAVVMRHGEDVAVIAAGQQVYQALLAAEALEKKGVSVRVINSHTIKPIDEKTISHAAAETGAIVTVEEHQVMGGMGSAVAEVVARTHPVPIEFVGIQDRFGESGEPEELLKHFGLDASGIAKAINLVLKRK